MTLRREHHSVSQAGQGVFEPAVSRLAAVLAASSLVAGAGTAVVPDLLGGTAVMNGSARGTGLVVAAVGVPVLLVSLVRSSRGSRSGAAVALGTGAYLTYNAVMLCFATPLNSLFPAYVVMLGAGLFLLANAVPVVSTPTAVRDGRLLRWIGVWILTVVLLNSVLWLRQVAGAVVSDQPTDALDGTGLTTNPVWVQDLAFWLPVMAWVALGALGVVRARPLLVAAGLAFWTLESVGVGVDQWWGHRADPASVWASSGAVVLFATTALVDLVLLWLALRWTRTTREPRGEERVDAPMRPRTRTSPD